MKPKLILLIVAVVVATSGLTVVTIHYSQRQREEQARRNLHTATTNVMRQLKPDTSPAIFPEK
jgi:hypothetical protein